MTNRASKGFTLIELLVVVSIVALLVALLLPALGRAGVAARTVQCQSQQRQIFMAFMAYVQHYKNYMPQQQWFRANDSDVILYGRQVRHVAGIPNQTWRDLIGCPDAKRAGYGAYSLPFYSSSTYGYNVFWWCAYGGTYSDPSTWTYHRYDATRRPALALIICDSSSSVCYSTGYYVGEHRISRHGGVTSLSNNPVVIGRAAVSLFADGHAERIEAIQPVPAVWQFNGGAQYRAQDFLEWAVRGTRAGVPSP